jgi:hypothetical protein
LFTPSAGKSAVRSTSDVRRTVAEMFGESYGLRWLPDGSILFLLWKTHETVTPYRVRDPGLSERIGTVPRPVTSFGLSNDLRRAAVVTRE